MTTTLLPIVPYLKSERGHFFNYHRAVNQAAELLGWRYVVAAPRTNSITDWPTHWQKCLEDPNPTFKPSWLSLLFTKRRYRKSLSSYLKHHSAPQGRNIVFAEYISLRQFRPLVSALARRPSKNLSFWMLFRFVPQKLPGDMEGFRRCMKTIIWLLGRENVRILVDTQDLVKHYEEFLDLPVHVMPIPHTSEVLAEETSRPTHKLICWCRGLPKPNMGVEVIEKLLNTPNALAGKVKLLFSEKALDHKPLGALTEFEILPEVLPQHDYMACMRDSDFILLPYSPKAYNGNSSGVFVEAITYGKIPLVTDGTWTARELRQYDLECLIIDWKRPDLAAEIVRISEDRSIRTRIETMQQAYQKYHCVESFAKAMNQL